MKVSRTSASLEAADQAVLRSHGFSDDDIWDIGAITAFFDMSNRLANSTGIRANPEFYTMGR
jgi:alkylhydroperoxidase family enzyme